MCVCVCAYTYIYIPSRTRAPRVSNCSALRIPEVRGFKRTHVSEGSSSRLDERQQTTRNHKCNNDDWATATGVAFDSAITGITFYASMSPEAGGVGLCGVQEPTIEVVLQVR